MNDVAATKPDRKVFTWGGIWLAVLTMLSAFIADFMVKRAKNSLQHRDDRMNSHKVCSLLGAAGVEGKTAIGSFTLWRSSVNIKRIFNRSAVAFAMLTAISINAQAANYGGKIDVASSTSGSTPMIRYYIAAQGLSIFAGGINETVLHEAFFRKATVSISYNVVVCPLGIVGTCGNLVSINVDASGFQ